MAQVGVGGGVGSGHDPDSIYGVGGEPGMDCVGLSVIPSSSVTHILKGVPIRHFKFRGSVRFARFFVRTAFWNLRGFGVVLDAVRTAVPNERTKRKRDSKTSTTTHTRPKTAASRGTTNCSVTLHHSFITCSTTRRRRRRNNQAIKQASKKWMIGYLDRCGV